MTRRQLIIIGIIFLAFLVLFIKNTFFTPMNNDLSPTSNQNLTPEQENIITKKGTEVPFSSPLYYEKRPGTYVAADTGKPVFRSEQKYESGTGWPSFWAPISPEAIQTKSDGSLGMERVEVLSSAGGHLGHVFTDGPEPTGLRYCINGDALIFIPDEEK